jgi:3-oxoacyl-ACP reductase-like protein
MPGVTRRTFLGRGSLAVAAAGVLSSVPGLSGLIGAGETEAPAADASVAGADAGAGAGAANLTEPLVAHVRDLSTGEMSLFNGTREVIVRDPQLANRLLRAAR